jgi:hypothetical protein
MSFEDAQVVPGIVNATYYLIASGTVPCLNMDVKLLPRIYIRRPEWWEIEVVGCLPEVCLTTVRRYVERLSLVGLWGTEGIELVGANGKKRFDKPSGVP